MISVPKLRSAGNVTTTFYVFIFHKSTQVRFQASMAKVGEGETPIILAPPSLQPESHQGSSCSCNEFSNESPPAGTASVCTHTAYLLKSCYLLGFPIPLSSFSLNCSDTRLAPEDSLQASLALSPAERPRQGITNWVTRINEKGGENAGERNRN